MERFRSERWIFTFILAFMFLFSCYCSHWLYGRLYSIDNYGYLGYMIDPGTYIRAFPLIPIGELVPAYLPAHLIFQTLGSESVPVTFVYKLLIASLALFFVSGAARALFGFRFGILAALLCFGHSYFLASMGSEYPLGLAILYMSGLLYFFAKASIEPAARRRLIWTAGAGICWGFMLSTALLTVVYTPGILLLFYGARRAHRGKWLEATDSAIFIGFFIACAICAMVYHHFTGSYFYFAVTLGKATGYLKTTRITVDSPNWFFEYGWLAMPMVLVVYGLSLSLFSITKKCFFDSPAPSVTGALALGFFALAYLQFLRNQGTLSDPYYFNQLIPLIALALTAAIYREFGEFLNARPKTFLALTFGTMFFVAKNFIKHDTGEVQVAQLACIAFLTSSLVVNRGRWRNIACCFGVPLLIALNFGVQNPGHDRVFYDLPLRLYSRQEPSIATVKPPLDMHEYKPEIQREIRDWYALIAHKDPQRTFLLWFDLDERYGSFFRFNSSITHLWQARLINEQFPMAVVPPKDFRGPSQIRPEAGMKVVVLTDDWEGKAPAASESLGGLGLSYSVWEKTRFNSGPSNYDVVFLDLKKL